MSVNRDSFIFYRSFQDAINEASEHEQLLIYRAIANYALNREEPQLQGVAKLAWLLIRPQLDANWKRFENGRKGGAPEGNKNNRYSKSTTKVQPKTNQSTTKVQANNNVNDNVNDNVNIIYGESTDSPTALSFENIWTLYGKKGNKKTSERKWLKLSTSSKKKALSYIPVYVAATPDKQYRKNLETFINQEVWNDELSSNNQVNDQSHEAERNYI